MENWRNGKTPCFHDFGLFVPSLRMRTEGQSALFQMHFQLKFSKQQNKFDGLEIDLSDFVETGTVL
jgi:hypothetical protein